MTADQQQQMRRAVRTGLFALTTFAAISFLGWIIHLMRTDAPTLRIIAIGLLGILFTGALGYTAENVTQRIKFHAGADGFDGEIGGG